MAKDLAGRLSRWRQLWGFSQRELSRRADITNSTLSQIEQGNTSPSVQTLQKIADAFGFSLKTLMFSEPCAPMVVKTEGAAPILPLSCGTAGVYDFDDTAPAFVRIHLKPNSTLEHAELLSTLKNSAGLSTLQQDERADCLSDSPEIAFGDWARLYLIAGELSVTVLGQSQTLWVGDSACAPLSQALTLACVGTETVELLLFPSFSTTN